MEVFHSAPMCYAINSKVFRIRVRKYIPLREFISDVVTSHGNWRFLLMNLQVQIWGVTLWYQSGSL